jgi:hypothetical protein
MERELPTVGTQVITPKGQGRVVAQEILAQKLVVEFEDRRRVIVGRDEVQIALPARGRPANPPPLPAAEAPLDGRSSQTIAREFESEDGDWSDLDSE